MPNQSDPHVLIFCPTYRAADDWAREHAEEYNLQRTRGWTFVRSIEQVQGRRPPWKIVVFSWSGSPLSLAQRDALEYLDRIDDTRS